MTDASDTVVMKHGTKSMKIQLDVLRKASPVFYAALKPHRWLEGSKAEYVIEADESEATGIQHMMTFFQTGDYAVQGCTINEKLCHLLDILHLAHTYDIAALGQRAEDEYRDSLHASFETQGLIAVMQELKRNNRHHTGADKCWEQMIQSVVNNWEAVCNDADIQRYFAAQDGPSSFMFAVLCFAMEKLETMNVPQRPSSGVLQLTRGQLRRAAEAV